MQKILLPVFLTLMLACCAPEHAPPKPVTSPEPDSLQQEPERKPLDLSPPQNLSFDDEDELDYTEPTEQGFDAKALFQKEEEESRVSGTVTPIITEGDDPDEAVVLDGGQVSIEVKTE
jgi:hypothetical protein